MKIKEDIRPISYVKANAASILEQVNETHRPVYITQNGEAKGVLLDTESYEKMIKAIGLLKVLSQGENDVREGRYQSQDEFFSEMDREFEEND